jgi:O-antigen ligase
MIETNEQRSGRFLSRLPYYSLIALIVSLGFIQQGFPLSGKQVIATDVLFIITVSFWTIATIRRQIELRWDKFLWMVIIYLAALGISVTFSTDLERSLTTVPIEVYLAGLSFIAFTILNTRRRIEVAVSAWLVGTVFAITVGLTTIALFYLDRGNALLEYLTYHYGAVPVGDFPRITSTFSSASMFCNFLNVGLVIALLALYQRWLRQPVTYVLIAGILICLLFTVSIGLGGIFMALGAFAIIIYQRHNTAAKTVAAVGVAAAVAFLMVSIFSLADYPNAEVWTTIGSLRLMPSSRVLVWRDSLQTFFQHPIVGNGLGLPVASTAVVNTDGSTSLLTDAHNSFLNVAAQSGLLGLFGLLAIVIYLLRIWIKGINANLTLTRALGFAFVCSFVYQGLTGSFEEARHLWVLMGMLVAAKRVETDA